MSAVTAVRATAKATPASDWSDPPALRDARAATAAARERESNLKLDAETAVHERRVAEAGRAKLIARRAAGEDIDPADVAAATAVIEGARAQIALCEEALPVAAAAVQRAQREEVTALRDAVAERLKEAREDAQAALARRKEAIAAHAAAAHLQHRIEQSLAFPDPAGLAFVLRLPRAGGDR